MRDMAPEVRQANRDFQGSSTATDGAAEEFLDAPQALVHGLRADLERCRGGSGIAFGPEVGTQRCHGHSALVPASFDRSDEDLMQGLCMEVVFKSSGEQGNPSIDNDVLVAELGYR